MARLARTVIPGVPHHVTQRGNRGQPVFFSNEDYGLYIRLLKDGCSAARATCLAWCLMPSHIHLVLVPETADGLRAAVAETHRRYSRHINARQGCTGYLFQGRFASYPMDDAHLMAAVRYVEINPVAAHLAQQPEDWHWSSARSHALRRRAPGDPLTDVAALGQHVRNWPAMLRHGLEASDVGAPGASLAEAIEARLRTGRPLAAPAWIADQAAALGRPLAKAKPGPKPTAG